MPGFNKARGRGDGQSNEDLWELVGHTDLVSEGSRKGFGRKVRGEGSGWMMENTQDYP